MPGSSFSVDVAAIRDRARQKMDQGPVAEAYGKDPADVIAVLNEVLATEMHADEERQHAMEEEHADGIVDLLGT
jgi:hypothetical protein